MQPDDRRDGEAARDDRRVRRDAADIGDEAAEAVALEENHVGGRKIVRHHDQLPLVRDLRVGQVVPAEQRLQHPLDHLLDVLAALAQIRGFHLLELLDEFLHLLHERPFRVVAALANQLARRLRQRRVIEDHPVQVDERGELVRGVGGDVRFERRQVLLGARDRRFEAEHFGRHRALGDLVMRDFEPRARDEMGMADRDTRRDARAVQRDVHRQANPAIGFTPPRRIFPGSGAAPHRARPGRCRRRLPPAPPSLCPQRASSRP